MQQDITKEHCDGNRNILHTCVAMCAPTSNKDYDQGKLYKTFNNWNFDFMPMIFTLLYLLFRCEKILLHSLESYNQKYFLQQTSH